MKGTLHKTENGWVVKYYIMRESSHAIHPNEYTLPILDHGYVNGPGLSDSDEGKEVEFEIVDEIIDLGRHGSTVVEKAKLVHNWLTMKEGDITVNFKPMPKFDEPISLLNSIRANPSWDTIIREFHIATQQVEIGTPPLIFECWLVDNYNPPTKKQD
jgi:hypothetical protein